MIYNNVFYSVFKSLVIKYKSIIISCPIIVIVYKVFSYTTRSCSENVTKIKINIMLLEYI